jgi:general secretion pathway protein K
MKAEGKKNDLLQDQRGMALLITIMTVSLLAAVTIQYHKTTWQEFLVSSNYKTGIQLKSITDSGVNIALALLQQDGETNQSDSLLDSWAVVEKEGFDGLFSGGTLKLRVADLTGRIPVNNLVRSKKTGQQGDGNGVEIEIRDILFRLLLTGDFPIEDEGEARNIVEALVDWIDEDDLESDYGAENSYYQSLDKPYSSRNGPIHYIEELLLVKGVTPQLLFGSGEEKGLADYLTVYGDDGKINLNTASTEVIKSFNDLISDELVEKLDEYRKDIGNRETLAQMGWYKDIGGWPGDIVINEEVLTTKSTHFQITAIGEFDTASRHLVAIAERVAEGGVTLLGRKLE